MIFIFGFLASFKINEEFAQSNDLPEIIFTLLLLLNGFVKFQYFLRIFEDFGVLVTMVGTTF
jgi:hypothetical protein